MRRAKSIAGATLLEILVAMLVIGLVATGIITAFVFSRRVTWRSSTELSGSGFTVEVTESLRRAINAPQATLPNNGLSLKPGVYVDQNMQNPPAGATAIQGLNFPPDFQAKFQKDTGTAGATVAAANHGDGRMVIVEKADENGNGIADEDLDGDGQIGLDFNGDQKTDLERVRVRIKWTSPTT